MQEHSSDQPEKTFPYFQTLPYQNESREYQLLILRDIKKNIYLCLEAGDYDLAADHWVAKQFAIWLDLKFSLPQDDRLELAKLFYHLALQPGIERNNHKIFGKAFVRLTKNKKYFKGVDFLLDWKPYYAVLKKVLFPRDLDIPKKAKILHDLDMSTMKNISFRANQFYDANHILDILQTILPQYHLGPGAAGISTVAALNLILPFKIPVTASKEAQPAFWLPTIFYLWQTVPDSPSYDSLFLGFNSRLAAECIKISHIPFGEYGLFSAEQFSYIFTAALRDLSIPVGLRREGAHLTNSLENSAVIGGTLLKQGSSNDTYSAYKAFGRIVVYSIVPQLEPRHDAIAELQDFIKSVETNLHPSNSGQWSGNLSTFIWTITYYLFERWSTEHEDDCETPDDRKLTIELVKRVTLILRPIIFTVMFDKNSKNASLARSALKHLAQLQPDLILPGALRRIYPSLQSIDESHRSMTCLHALASIAQALVDNKYYRCHVIPLMSLVLNGINPINVDKCVASLDVLQTFARIVPFVDLSDVETAQVAMDWIGSDVEMIEKLVDDDDCDQSRPDDDIEETVFKGTTSSFPEILTTYIGKVFTVLENLPERKVRSGKSPEDSVVLAISGATDAIFSGLSSELFDHALDKIVHFAVNNVLHHATDAMSYLCNCCVQRDSFKTFRKLLPLLLANIRSEIEDNRAGSARATGTEIPPRDRALVWNLQILTTCCHGAGSSLYKYGNEFKEIISYILEKCQGLTMPHAVEVMKTYLGCLVNFTPLETRGSKEDQQSPRRGQHDWGVITDLKNFSIAWHNPSQDEISLAVEIFLKQTAKAISALDYSMNSYMNLTPKARIECVDDMCRNLNILRSASSSVSVLFDPATGKDVKTNWGEDEDIVMPPFYASGFFFKDRMDDTRYLQLVAARTQIAEQFLKMLEYMESHCNDEVRLYKYMIAAISTWFCDFGMSNQYPAMNGTISAICAEKKKYGIKGARKQWPRTTLVRRASAYQLLRHRINIAHRNPTLLDKKLTARILDLSISPYAEIRINAQATLEIVARVIAGSRFDIASKVLESTRTDNLEVIKGALFTMLVRPFQTVIISSPSYMRKAFANLVLASKIHKPSIQILVRRVQMTLAMEFNLKRRFDYPVQGLIKASNSDQVSQSLINTLRSKIEKKADVDLQSKIAFRKELIEIAGAPHTVNASFAVSLLHDNLADYCDLPEQDLLTLCVKGLYDSHPQQRYLWYAVSSGILSPIWQRVFAQNNRANWVLDEVRAPNTTYVSTQSDPDFLELFLHRKVHSNQKQIYFDSCNKGWLAWPDRIEAWSNNLTIITQNLTGEERESVDYLAKQLTPDFFRAFFERLTEEPPGHLGNNFNHGLVISCKLLFTILWSSNYGATPEEVKEQILEMYGKGSIVHQHRALSEVLSALLRSLRFANEEQQEQVWEWIMPLLQKIFSDDLTPDNINFWKDFIHISVENQDPLRSEPLISMLLSFRLDRSSNAAFKEASRFRLIRSAISMAGWKFPTASDTYNHLVLNIDHPFTGVRKEIAACLNRFDAARVNPSFRNALTLLTLNYSAGTLGAFRTTNGQLRTTWTKIFQQIDIWRLERQPGTEIPTPYTLASKTVISWLKAGFESIRAPSRLAALAFDLIYPAILHMADVKEDDELSDMAQNLLVLMSAIQYPSWLCPMMVQGIVQTAQSEKWHHRQRILQFIQVFYFDHLFRLTQTDKSTLREVVIRALADPQLEIRQLASYTLGGIVTCSATTADRPDGLDIPKMAERFSRELDKFRLPFQRAGDTNPGTPDQGLLIGRHAAVLGLGALILAFPYSIEREWMPKTLALYARKAASDSGMIGNTVKKTLADFKKTHSESWVRRDIKFFSQEELDDLEGVFTKSYFV
ncbi:Proteasome activator complex subunit 4 [Neolecta irregularis DAH-3]|uniref:Proteasome activator complex subunit 4 n=1 Tax=Neolecta irregularis (strain DAH-3) TaxID=1198029 RepID=A0A1U7LLL2_NEOID|nr:Proteasome activator complex subunit 4 [Neolecta irregularis DAH-3]|eukprot:OLL23544.1 Proteasome activator complex subunit 4 [Neolecta irregularis DAH-3]